MSGLEQTLMASFWLEHVWRDLRHSGRVLARNPGFAAIAVLSLAIGIGVNAAIFSVADGLLLKPLPVARPDEVFTVGSTSSLDSLGSSALVSSYPEYVDIRDRSKSFDGLVAFADFRAGVAAEPTALPALKMGMLVSGNLFAVMGVEPTIGRSFRPQEDQVPGRDAVVILGPTMWAREFSSDPSVIGRTIRINGIPFTVIGIVPPTFVGLDPYVRSDFFVPLMMSQRLLGNPKAALLESRDARNLSIKGRLRRGISQAQAQAELTAIATDLERAYPHTNRNRRFVIRTELQARIALDPPNAMLIAMLSALAMAVLVVACANVGGLLTSRAPVRAREMAMRLAIGASRGRLVRQLMTESLVIALIGGVLALGVGYAGLTLFRQIRMPTDLPIALSFEMDRRALLFSLAVAVASAVFFGVVPAFQAARTDPNAVLKAAAGFAAGPRRRWGRAVLVVGQVAISVVLLVVTMFMYRGFRNQLLVGPGYRTDHLLMMSFDPSLVHYTEAEAQQFFQNVAERARTVPGVERVTMATSVPMAIDSIDAETVVPEGFQLPPGKDDVTVRSSSVDEYYFDAMGMAILRGRAFRRDDTADAPRVAIVNQRFADHYWPNQDPIGRRLRLADGDNAWVQIVGLTKTSKYIFIAEPPTDFVYFAYRQTQARRMTMLVQSSGDAAQLAAPLREVVRRIDPNPPMYNVRTMEEFYQMRAVNVFHVLVAAIGGMGMMGLGLSIAGLYGLVAYAASRRTREIGIRMAIGAERSTVLRMVLRQGLALAIAGLAIGLVASIGAGALLRSVFPIGSNQQNVVAFVVVVLGVVAVTFVATYVPARQAARVDPVQALRHE
jgi:predicted permease